MARLKAGDPAGAVEWLRQALAAAPDDAKLALALGVALQRAGRHDEAIEAFQRAEAAGPGDAAGPLHMALSELSLGRASQAVEAAARACRLAPNLAAAHAMRGRALLSQGEAAEAARAFAEALRLAPASAETWRLCARARRAAGDLAGAAAASREAARLAPDAAPAAAGLDAWRPTNAAAALGLSVEYLSQKPAFAALPFGEWSQVLFHQVARGHYLFVVDGEQRIRGFLGWTLTDAGFAEAWVAGRAGLRNESGEEGDCVIVNAWAADDGRANRFLRGAALRLFADRRAVYFKRHYPDGRERPMRLETPAHRRKPPAP